MKIEFYRQIFEKCSNFVKIRPMVIEFFFDVDDRQADMT